MALQMLIVYLMTGAAFALFVLVWALGSRQFQEQDRARFLPLRDLTDEELERKPRRKITPSVAMVFVILAAGFGVFVHLIVRMTMSLGG